jgi:hypothetical protein
MRRKLEKTEGKWKECLNENRRKLKKMGQKGRKGH